MKLKRIPEDFQVEELTSLRPTEHGRFTLYRLTKRGLGTLEAVEAICRRWNLSGRQVSYGGLKDRHAVTIQYLTIVDGPKRSLHESSFDLEPVGRLALPVRPAALPRQPVRDRAPRPGPRAARPRRRPQLEAIARDGLPNYFDDQRFGSVGFAGEFIGQAWLKGDHEPAPQAGARRAQPVRPPGRRRPQKAILRELWGRLGRGQGQARTIVRPEHRDLPGRPPDRLPRRLRPDEAGAPLALLLGLPEPPLEPGARRAGSSGTPGPSSGRWSTSRSACWPFPGTSSRSRGACSRRPRSRSPRRGRPSRKAPLGSLIAEVLAPFDLSWDDLRVRHLKDVFLSKGSRAAIVFPRQLEAAPFDDELHRGRHALRLKFELPKGSYATILVKRITELTGPS